MATQAQQYTLLFVTVNGSLLTEEASCDVKRVTGSQAVTTVAKGYAGESPGAHMCEIDVENAVPSAGFEFDAGAFMESLEAVEIGILGPGGKQLTAKGFITEDSIKHATNQESKYSFKFRGTFAKFE